MDPRISRLIDSLPTLTKDDVDIHDYCPICFVDFKTILDDDDSESEPAGITRLVGCSHVFCRKDLIQWIQSWHGSCPTCRNIFISNLYPDSESDNESDDDEYVPEHDEFEESFEDEEEDEEEDDEDDEDGSSIFDGQPFIGDGDGDAESLNAFREEDDQAIGLGITDVEFEDNEELLMEIAASQEAAAEEMAQTAEEYAARIEAELQDEDVGFAELFSVGDLVEEEHRRLEEEFFLEEELEECTDLPDWDDSEDLRFSVGESFRSDNEALEEELGNEEFDQR